MQRVPYGKYTREFREEAVKLVTEEHLSQPEVCKGQILLWARLGKRNLRLILSHVSSKPSLG